MILKLPYALQLYESEVANIMFDMHNDDSDCELKEYAYDKKNKKSKYSAIYKAKEQE